MVTTQTATGEETQQFAKDFAKQFTNKGAIIALIGDLGAGKTTFVQGFAEGLNIKDKIISPTFVLMRQHQIKEGRTLFHIDLYRLSDNPDIENIGIKDLLEDSNNIVLIEWAEKIKEKLPKGTFLINIEKAPADNRKISISTL